MKAPLESATYAGVTEIPRPLDVGDPRSVPAADAAALSLVFLLFFCVVCFAVGAIALRRRERNIPAEDATGGPGDAEPAKDGRQHQKTAAPPEWERDGDWWKS